MPAVSESRLPQDDLVVSRPSWTWVPWAVFLVAFVLATAVPLPAGLSRPGAYALAGLLAAVVFWASGVQDPSLSGLLLITLLSLLGVMPFERAVAGFGTEFVWLLVMTFILAQAMADTGLGRRIALILLHMASVRWNVIILFGVSLALADALERSGAGAWLTSATLRIVAHPAPLAVALMTAPLVLLIRIGFVNNLGMIAAGLPLAFTLAKGWGLDPLWTGMVVVMTAGPGFILPTQTPTGMITVDYEYYSIRDYIRAGVPASVVLLALT